MEINIEEKILPKNFVAKYGVSSIKLSEWLGISKYTLYTRNYRKSPLKKHELELIKMKINQC